MSIRYRVVFTIISIVILILVSWPMVGNLTELLNQFWFVSGFLLLILLSLVDQPFFSRDSNILVNGITGLSALFVINQQEQGFLIWLFFVYMIYLIISSSILMFIRSRSLKEEGYIIRFFSRLNRIIGEPRVIFSMFFIWGLLLSYDLNSFEFALFFILWVTFMVFSFEITYDLIINLFEERKEKLVEGIGKVFGVQSQNIFLVKVNQKTKKLDLFTFVELKHSVDNRIYRGIVSDVMVLDQEQWIKVFSNKEIRRIFEDVEFPKTYKKDVVYLIDDVPENDYMQRFVGVVTKDSDINKIRFLYNSSIAIKEGSLLETTINNQIVVYQVINAITELEQLENKNQSGYIIGEALQLGVWDHDRYEFERFGWIPDINTPLYLAKGVEEPLLMEGEYLVGEVPDTKYPVIINKEIAITHHLAITGVTGSGKSVFARNLIREFMKDKKIKVICIDFTEEYREKLEYLEPVGIISEEYELDIRNSIKEIIKEESKYPNRRNHEELDGHKKIVFNKLRESIENFLDCDENNLSIIDIPDFRNTPETMYFTMVFISTLFWVAKDRKDSETKISLVLEEAHTIVPEWNFLGQKDNYSDALINTVAQVALQGRKFNVGLLVIAQRTANVSKTILTQCNSIISFKQFDDTSINFLSNYYGEDIAESVSNLRPRQAIAVGSAFKSSIPMIFEVPEIKE